MAEKEKSKTKNLFKSKKARLFGTIITTAMVVDYCHLKEEQLTPDKNNVVQERQESNETAQYEKIYKEILRGDPVIVDSKKILNDYANTDDYEEVNSFYKDKYIEVTGTVGEIIDEDTIKLANEDNSKWYSEMMGIKCSFEDETELSRLSTIEVGDKVVVEGYCDGYNGMSVELDNCLFNTLR